MLQSSHFLESVVPKGVPTEELLIHCDYLKFKKSSYSLHFQKLIDLELVPYLWNPKNNKTDISNSQISFLSVNPEWAQAELCVLFLLQLQTLSPSFVTNAINICSCIEKICQGFLCLHQNYGWAKKYNVICITYVCCLCLDTRF